MATMAVQWVLANPAITSPIIGASRPDQLKDSVAAVDAPIDPDVREQLDQLTYEFRFGDNAR
jgi:aryl-alcohol dehydrogenase-like predicted oxidoreductase